MLRRTARRLAITGGLSAAHMMRGLGLMGSARGRGAIFTLHHVRPTTKRTFKPNAHLEITPDFLDAALTRLTRDGYRFLALDDLPAHLESNDRRPVAVLTLDDGYCNTLDHARPVFARHSAPFTVFVTEGFIDRTHSLWWETLEALLTRTSAISFDFGEGEERIASATTAQKQAAFDRIGAFIMETDETAAIAKLDALAREQGIDPLSMTERLTLDEAGLNTLCASPLARLGAHTISHRALARLDAAEARRELERSRDRVTRITGAPPSSFAYPYGSPAAVSSRDHQLAEAAGFACAVTTQPGVLHEGGALHALPRISLNGHFQKPRHVTALASGIPFKLRG